MFILCRHSVSVSGTFVPKGLENKYLFLNFTENKHGMLSTGLVSEPWCSIVKI